MVGHKQNIGDTMIGMVLANRVGRRSEGSGSLTLYYVTAHA